jgi:hypothetical protein
MCDTMPALSSDKGKHYDMEKHKRKLQKVNLSITVLTDDFELNVKINNTKRNLKQSTMFTQNEFNAVK